MTRPDHTAVPPADVIAAAWPEATDIDLLRDAAYAYWLFVKKHEGPHQAGLVANAQRLDQLIDRMARAQGAAPTAAQAAGRSVAQCTNSDSWNCKYCRKTETCEALKDPRNFGAPSASHAQHATLAASRDAESATSDATSAAKLSVGVLSSGADVYISVQLKQGEYTTVLYGQRHPANQETLGWVDLPAGLFASKPE
jgi:uncharacterized protein RhaS with RHS repeats